MMRNLKTSHFLKEILLMEERKMATTGVIHSFLEERPLNRDEESLDNHICVRFIRKKFKCLIIFFLALCVLGETLIMTMDRLQFDNLNAFVHRFINGNETSIN